MIYTQTFSFDTLFTYKPGTGRNFTVYDNVKDRPVFDGFGAPNEFSFAKAMDYAIYFNKSLGYKRYSVKGLGKKVLG